MVTRKRLYSESCHFLALAGITYKYNQCHTTSGGLSSACAKLEPASSKHNELLEINVLQKFVPHALWDSCGGHVDEVKTYVHTSATFTFQNHPKLFRQELDVYVQLVV